jgi:N6-adenosine-specific RNA methylase IME4
MEKTMDKHRFNIFPEMQQEDYNRLKSDILTNGYDKTQPIWLYEGTILDGWNRQKACDELDITPEYALFEGSNIEAINFVMRTNKRRNLTSSQWSCIAINAEEIVAAIKEAVEKERRAKQAETQSQTKGETGLCRNKFPDSPKEPEEARIKIAEVFNTNPRYISDAQRLKRTAPEKFNQVLSGEKTITEVKKEEKIEKRKQEIEQIKTKIEEENFTISDKYDVLAIDPPWNYGREYDPETSRVANPYPEMTTADIAKIELPIKDNAVVFLWTTHAFIQDAFELLKIWKLKYRATLVWDKDKMGMGNTVRMQCEFCLIATKGSPLIQGSSERDIIREPRREHSRKPEAFYLQVERMTTGRRLDYFARSKRDGWDVYGAETEKY